MTTAATATRPPATPLPLGEKNGQSTGGETRDKALNLYQRLALISQDVTAKATGKTAFPGSPVTLSITDIERALGDLTARYGVVTGYRYNEKPEQQGSLWLANLTVWLVNADNPDDKREETVYDVGNSPSAAVSYAIKRYYRALFHLADEQDEQRTVSGNGAPAGQSPRTPPAGSKMSTAEQARIVRLNETLPTPKPPIVLEALVRDLPYDKALAQMTQAHAAQCAEKPDCEHVRTGGAAA